MHGLCACISLFALITPQEVMAYGNPEDCDRSSLRKISALAQDTSAVLQRTLPQTQGKLPKPIRTAAIYGDIDPRVDIEGDALKAYPFSAIGSLSVHGCTASRISACHILTNSHCVYEDDGTAIENSNVFASSEKVDEWRKSNNITMEPGDPLVDFVHKWSDFQGSYREDSSRDWAIGVLSRSTGDATGYFGLLAGDPTGVHGISHGAWPNSREAHRCQYGNEPQTTGYSNDRRRPNQRIQPLSNDPTTRVIRFQRENKVFEFRASTSIGSSGGPTWVCQTDGSAQIFGINSQVFLNEDGSQMQLPVDENHRLALGIPISAIYDDIQKFMRENPCPRTSAPATAPRENPGNSGSGIRPRPNPRR